MFMRRALAAVLAAHGVAVLADGAGPANATHPGNSSTASPEVAASPSPAAMPLLRKGSPGNSGAASGTAASAANATGRAPEPVALDAEVHVTAFMWNVHWQCSVAARGSTHACKQRMGSRFVQLAQEAGAEIVTSIELSNGMSEPVSLVGLGLSGWTQVNGPCARGGGGDSTALAFAPGWVVQKSGGGCLRHDYDTRAFAVARVTPPSPVQGCPSLCVVAVHTPHTDITTGKSVVSEVCAEAAASCTVAMGDWNTPVEGLGHFWQQLVDGSAPTVAFPNERTCCFPESQHYGVFDHLASNVAGAQPAGYHVYDYQVLEENPVQEHKPVRATVALPAGR